MSTYRVMIPLRIFGESDARRLARQHELNGDGDAAAVLYHAAEAIRKGELKPDRTSERNVYLFGGGRGP